MTLVSGISRLQLVLFYRRAAEIRPTSQSDAYKRLCYLSSHRPKPQERSEAYPQMKQRRFVYQSSSKEVKVCTEK